MSCHNMKPQKDIAIASSIYIQLFFLFVHDYNHQYLLFSYFSKHFHLVHLIQNEIILNETSHEVESMLLFLEMRGSSSRREMSSHLIQVKKKSEISVPEQLKFVHSVIWIKCTIVALIKTNK